MAEERNLTTTGDKKDSTGTELSTETRDAETPAEPTKQELHQRMEQARDSITQTVSELKETVTTKVDQISGGIARTLDWREHVNDRPLTFSLGALVAGFAAGTLFFGKGKSDKSHARRSLKAAETDDFYESAGVSRPKKIKQGPTLFEKVVASDTFGRLQTEAAKIGERLVDEAVKVGNDVLLPAVVGKLHEVVEEFVPAEKPSASGKPKTSIYGQSPKSAPDKSGDSDDKKDAAHSKANNT